MATMASVKKVSTILVVLFVSATSSCALRDTMKGKVTLKENNPIVALPDRIPERVYVGNFDLDAARFTSDDGLRGNLPGPVGQKQAHTRDESTQMKTIVDQMANTITETLSKGGLPALRLLSDSPSSLPRSGWLVKGVFTEVDQGSRLKRAAIGFGQGATQMEVQVGVSDLSSAQPTVPFAVFGTVKEQGNRPGAIVTLNPYMAAARFVMEKNATSNDIEKTAEQIAYEVLKFRDAITKRTHP